MLLVTHSISALITTPRPWGFKTKVCWAHFTRLHPIHWLPWLSTDSKRFDGIPAARISTRIFQHQKYTVRHSVDKPFRAFFPTVRKVALKTTELQKLKKRGNTALGNTSEHFHAFVPSMKAPQSRVVTVETEPWKRRRNNHCSIQLQPAVKVQTSGFHTNYNRLIQPIVNG